MSRGKKREQRTTRWARRQWARPKTQLGATEKGEADRTRRSGGRWKTIALLAAVVAAIPVVSVSAWLLFFRSAEPPGPPRAAIVDQLSLTFPNPSFAEDATRLLEQAGYVVDYYPGEQVTVDFYRYLPSRDYDFILLRTHSSLLFYRDDLAGQLTAYDAVGLFTAEPYDEKRHFEDQRLKRLVKAHYFDGGPYYFGVLADFFESSARGRFDDATVIVMGCAGLGTSALAEALLDKGAEEVVGWDGLVSAAHTDAATERLLEHLLDGGLSVKEAVARTMAEVGPDPTYDSVLLSYSAEG